MSVLKIALSGVISDAREIIVLLTSVREMKI